MSYERQRNVFDGQEIINKEDIEGRCPTKGTLVHGEDAFGNAAPISLDNSSGDGGSVNVYDAEVIYLLTKILKELKKANTYNALLHDMEIENSDIEDN